MPIHDYHCSECGAEFESLSAPLEPVECAKCKSRLVNKQPCVTKSYTIKGANDASTTPKKHRGDGS